MHLWQIQAVRDVLLVAAVVGLIWLGYALRTVTVPLLVALLLAYLFEPFIAWTCQRWHIRRALAAGGLLAAGGTLLLATLAIVLPLLIAQTMQFINDIQDGDLRSNIHRFVEERVPATYQQHFQRAIEVLPAGTSTRSDSDSPRNGSFPSKSRSAEPKDKKAIVPSTTPTDEHIAQMIDRQIDIKLRTNEAGPGQSHDQNQSVRWLDIAKGTTNAILQVIGAIVRLGLLTFLIPFYFFFFSMWYPDVVNFTGTLIPTKNRERAIALLSRMDRVVAGFVRGRIVISLIMGALLAIGWWICGVPYAIMLGLVVGIFCAIPYLGVMGIPLAIGLLLFDQIGLDPNDRMAWWAIILWPTLIFVIVQMIEGYALTPMIAGKVTNLDPVTIIVAVLAGGSVLGVYGMLLAIPLAACGKILVTDVLLHNVRAWARGEIADPLPIERE